MTHVSSMFPCSKLNFSFLSKQDVIMLLPEKMPYRIMYNTRYVYKNIKTMNKRKEKKERKKDPKHFHCKVSLFN